MEWDFLKPNCLLKRLCLIESSEIGQKLFITSFDPLFLKTGITLTILSDDGKTPVSKVRPSFL